VFQTGTKIRIVQILKPGADVWVGAEPLGAVASRREHRPTLEADDASNLASPTGAVRRIRTRKSRPKTEEEAEAEYVSGTT
jgi:hypothetical protein